MADRTSKANSRSQPYPHPAPRLGTLVQQLNLLATNITPRRFDVNVSTLEAPRRWLGFTFLELEALSANFHPDIGTLCEMCGLVVPKYGFGWYVLDKEHECIVVPWKVCKACWKFDNRSPEYDEEEMDRDNAPRIPMCSCAPGSIVAEKADCALHCVPSMVPVPCGRAVHRPKWRSEVRDEIQALYERRAGQRDIAHAKLRDVLNSTTPTDAAARQQNIDKLTLAWEQTCAKAQGALDLRVQLSTTSLADFAMPPPSPLPSPPCIHIPTCRIHAPKIPCHLVSRKWS
ncbi:hypothetical protein B0H14DRAFT_3474143 [Mycena olivaceomarginata]|nr:hypothetical protein B0H14DRAFT_3474143 [Mycena olivaceomarginata]